MPIEVQPPVLTTTRRAIDAPARAWRVCVWLLWIAALCMAMAAWSWQQAQQRWQATAQSQLDLTTHAWASMLHARLELPQRLLRNLAVPMHSSLLDSPAVLQNLMAQERELLHSFDSLYLALPGGTVHEQLLASESLPLDSAGRQLLLAHIGQEHAYVAAWQPESSSDVVHVLVMVPAYRGERGPHAVLAGLQHWPAQQLLLVVPQAASVKLAVLQPQGGALAHSQGHDVGRLGDVVPAAASSSQSATQIRSEHMLVMPAWRLLAEQASEAGWLAVWGAKLLAGLALLVGLGAIVMWWAARKAGAQVDVQTRYAPLQWQEPPTPVADLSQWWMQPEALLQAHARGLHAMSPAACAVLGWRLEEGQIVPWGQWMPVVAQREQVTQALQQFGSFSGEVQLCKRDGGLVQVSVQIGRSPHDPQLQLWRVQLPWRLQTWMHAPPGASRRQDSLTGLPTRESLRWAVQSWITAVSALAVHGQRELPPAQGCVMHVDVDHLGLLNATASREMGDAALRHIAQVVCAATAPLGEAARLGGDEFAVLLPGLSLAHAHVLGQMLCEQVAQWQPHWGGERHWIGISIGVVAMDAMRHTAEDALRAADMACYEAKRRGRNQVALGQITARGERKLALQSC